MLRVWKKENGLTLIELLASVVILALVIVPFTNIGTTVWKWNEQDKMLNEAVLLAQQELDQAKMTLEQGNAVSPTSGMTSDHFTWKIAMQAHPLVDTNVQGVLTDVTVTVTAPDLLNPAQTDTLTTLTTVVRKK